MCIKFLFLTEKRLVEIQDRLVKIPDEIEKCKNDDMTVDTRKQTAFEEFRTKCQRIVDVRDKKIKLPRKKVVRKKKRDEDSTPQTSSVLDGESVKEIRGDSGGGEDGDGDSNTSVKKIKIEM